MISLRPSHLGATGARRRSWWPLLVATTVTAGLFVVVLGSLRRVLPDRRRSLRGRDTFAEHVVLVQPRTAQPSTTETERARRSRSSSATPMPPTVRPPAQDTGTVATPASPTTTSERASPAPVAISPNTAPTSTPSSSLRAGRWMSPRAAFDPIGEPAPPTSAERDAVLSALSTLVPDLAARRVPTPAERDSASKEATLKMRQSGRILLVPPDNSGGMITAPLPVLSRGPSRAKRAHDERAHDEGRARLQRLLARADSLRRAHAESLAARSVTRSSP